MRSSLHESRRFDSDSLPRPDSLRRLDAPARTYHTVCVVVWRRALVLCAFVFSCGGRAQRDEVRDLDTSGGSPNEATAGQTGATAGHAGTTDAAGGFAGSVVIPTAGNGGASGSPSGEGGAPVWTGFDGPPPGEAVGAHECPQGPATDYGGPLPEIAPRFRGALDGIPIDFSASELAVDGGCRGKTWTVELYFDGQQSGDQLTLYFDSDAGCFVQGWYVPRGGSAEATSIQVALHVWNEGDTSDLYSRTSFVYAELTLESKAPDGSVTHRLEGELTLHLQRTEVCVN